MKKTTHQDRADNRLSDLLIGFGVVICAYFGAVHLRLPGVRPHFHLYPEWFHNLADHHTAALYIIGVGSVALGC